MTNPLAPEIRARIDAHLDAVETHLQAAGATNCIIRGGMVRVCKSGRAAV
jgi:hypothetical protein